MNTILVLIKLAKMFATLHVVGKYLYYSIVYPCYSTIPSYVCSSCAAADVLDLNKSKTI